MTRLGHGIMALTPQQVRVLMMLSEGLPTRQMASDLGITEETIKAHVSDILQKLDVESRTQAVIAAEKIAGGQSWQQRRHPAWNGAAAQGYQAFRPASDYGRSPRIGMHIDRERQRQHRHDIERVHHRPLPAKFGDLSLGAKAVTVPVTKSDALVTFR